MTVSKSLGATILKVALSLFLIISGIITVQLDGGIVSQFKSAFGGNEIASAIYSLFGRGNISGVLIIIIGILELAGGIFLLINMFAPALGPAKIIMLIITIMWLVVIVLVDILGEGGLIKGAFGSGTKFLSFLKGLSGHLMILGALLQAQEE
ncbi:MAG: hypothetical protein NC041_00765 [Bacteroides sp.]|nr:hypothetical protein [Prevotella sp.]MCM1408009.1 hypothetical protein [Treponema brennaborense]MCM1468985.1 hypothetical protein [Bacteroides sp.]